MGNKQVKGDPDPADIVIERGDRPGDIVLERKEPNEIPDEGKEDPPKEEEESVDTVRQGREEEKEEEKEGSGKGEDEAKGKAGGKKKEKEEDAGIGLLEVRQKPVLGPDGSAAREGRPLRASYWHHQGQALNGGAGAGEGAEDRFVFECLLCQNDFQSDELYVLERCGHFFCTECLFQHAKNHLASYCQHRKLMQRIKQDIRDGSSLEESLEKSVEGEYAEQADIVKHFEILCPLHPSLCGIAISQNDLEQGFRTFSQPLAEQELLLGYLREQDGAEDKKSPVVKAGNDEKDVPLGLRVPQGHLEDDGADPSNAGADGAAEAAGDGGSAEDGEGVVKLTESFEEFLALNKNFVRCPNEKCGYIFERVDSHPDPNAKVTDDFGKPVTGEQLSHYNNFRFRCRNCDEIFCSECKATPYHLNLTCAEFAFYKDAKKHCRFCDTALPVSFPPFELELDEEMEAARQKRLQKAAEKKKGKEEAAAAEAAAREEEEARPKWSRSYAQNILDRIQRRMVIHGLTPRRRRDSVRLRRRQRRNRHNGEDAPGDDGAPGGAGPSEPAPEPVSEEGGAAGDGVVEMEVAPAGGAGEGRGAAVGEVVADKKEEAEVAVAEVGAGGAKGEPAIDVSAPYFVCDEEECRVKAKLACQKRHSACGHLCGGVLDEEECLPCLHEDCYERVREERREAGQPVPGQEGTDYCNICWVEDLDTAPSILLRCEHTFHFKCVEDRISKGWPGPTITFGFSECPLCNKSIEHPLLEEETDTIASLKSHVQKIGVEMLQVEGMLKDDELVAEGSPYFEKPEAYALHVFDFYTCYVCKSPYYGGKHECAQGVEADKIDVKMLRCPSCTVVKGGNCEKHGKDYMNFKCRFCCEPATFNCGGGLAHYCDPCHARAGELTDFSGWLTKNKEKLPKCNPKKCPLNGHHAENGEEFGYCALCMSAMINGDNVVVVPEKWNVVNDDELGKKD